MEGSAEVDLVSDAREGPCAGVHPFPALEFLVRLVDHVPGKGEVRVRYYGAYASRRRGRWRRRGVVLAGEPPAATPEVEREAAERPGRQARARGERWVGPVRGAAGRRAR